MIDDVCVVVGAGPGIGQAVARRFAREGFGVGLIARRPEAVEQAVASLGALGTRAGAYPADAGRPGELTAALEAAASELGQVTCLVYNAYSSTRGSPTTLDPEALAADLRVNVGGLLVAARTVAPAMEAAGSGTVLVTGGGLSIDPFPDYASLGAGKAAQRNVAISLSKELGPHGVHVAIVIVRGIVAPGTAFDADLIADHYWRLHCQQRDDWEHEVLYDG